MSRFYQNLLLVIFVIGLCIYLFYRFIQGYTSAMDRTYYPNHYMQEETDEDTTFYPPSNKE